MAGNRNNNDQVTAFAPATVANLGPGFDVLGLALEGAGDTVTARLTGDDGVTITRLDGVEDGALPTSAEQNTAGVAAAATLRLAGVDAGLELELTKGLPLGSGLGSSAASAAAAAMATNLVLGAPLRKADLVAPCLEAEAVVSGRHADNVAPAILGGLVLVRSVAPLDLVRLPLPEGLFVVVVTPALEVSTRAARGCLAPQVPLSAVVHNSANLAGLISACHSGDLALLARCVRDEVAEPARAALIPGARKVMDAALEVGALGSSISGSGPSIFALCPSERIAGDVAAAMGATFSDHDLQSSDIISPAECPGARRLS